MTAVVLGLVLLSSPAVARIPEPRVARDDTREAPFEVLDAPRQNYRGLGVLPSGELVVTVTHGVRATVLLTTIELRTAGGDLVHELNPPPDAGCDRATGYETDGMTTDGRALILETCYYADSDRRWTFRLLAYDTTTNALELLSDLGRFSPSGNVSWNLAAGRGIGSEDSDLVAWARWFDPAGTSPIDVRIPGRGGFRLDGPEPGEFADCGDFGRARGPQFSPDGAQVALLAGPRAVGTRSFDCLDLSWHVAAFATDEHQARILARGFTYAAGVTWSPDGRTLAVTAKEGLFLVDALNGGKTRISRQNGLSPPAWSPDGRYLYASQTRGGDGSDRRLIRFDLRPA